MLLYSRNCAIVCTSCEAGIPLSLSLLCIEYDRFKERFAWVAIPLIFSGKYGIAGSVSMGNQYTRSIFAYELEAILKRRQKSLLDMTRVPLTFERKKVESLVESLKNVKRLPALNYGEIMSIVIELRLGKEERLRLRAALI